MNLMSLIAQLSLDASQYKQGLQDAENDANSFGGRLARGFGTAAKLVTGAVAAGGAAVGALVKQSVEAYADYEQLIGGVETLFGDSAKKVLADAEDAYKTAGMSVNEYMETSIQSAAAMINSIGGDQEKAAELMNLSITDMADNVNKMGTTMEAVQNAYRGFSRGNFTMLDNLALGFAGTKEGMQELLDKAQEISGITFDIESYSDIVQAIHIVQENMGITGTTAKEAEKTISGSLASLKSAWRNLVTGLGRDDADLDRLIDNVVNSAESAFNNIIPIAEKVIDGIVKLVDRIAPILEEKLPQLIDRLLPAILKAGSALLNAILPTLPKLAGTLISSFFGALAEQAPLLIPVVAGALASPILGMIKNVVGGLGTLKSAFSGLTSGISGIGSTFSGISSTGLSLSGVLSSIGTAALGAADALLVLYDVQALKDAAETYEEAHEAHINETETALSNYAKIYEEKGKEVADEWASMAYAIDTTNMSFDEAQAALTSKIETYWDGVPQNMWDGFKAGWNDYFGENGKGLGALLGDAFTGAVDGVKGLLGIHSPSTVFENIGTYMMSGLQNGIIEGALKVIETAKNVAKSILNAIKGFFGISSPSTVMAEMGGYLDEGFAQGIFGKEKLITDAMDDVFNIQPSISQNGMQNFDVSSTGREIVVPRTSDNSNQSAVMMVDRTVFARLVYTLYNEHATKVGLNVAGVGI